MKIGVYIDNSTLVFRNRHVIRITSTRRSVLRACRHGDEPGGDLALRGTPRTPSSGAEEQGDRIAMMGELDAIIQVDGRLPPEEAATLYPEFPVQSIILLSRGDAAADPFLLDIFRNDIFRTENNKWNSTWLAARNLLIHRKPSGGFAATVLEGLTIHISARILNTGSAAVGTL